METVGEQALLMCELASAGPAAVRQVAAARPAVTVVSTVRRDRWGRRRMAVTVGRVGDGREALR